jgi:uncharacterized membrane protein
MSSIIEQIQAFPPVIATFIMAMLPIIELRGSIPFAMGVYGMPAWMAFSVSVLGDIIPATLIILFLKPVALWLSAHSVFFDKIFKWWFQRTISKFEKKFNKYGPWALMIFVAIPLPVTGAWTGSVASFLFDIPKKKAFLFVFLGVVIAGIIVTLISSGAFSFFRAVI